MSAMLNEQMTEEKEEKKCRRRFASFCFYCRNSCRTSVFRRFDWLEQDEKKAFCFRLNSNF